MTVRQLPRCVTQALMRFRAQVQRCEKAARRLEKTLPDREEGADDEDDTRRTRASRSQ